MSEIRNFQAALDALEGLDELRSDVIGADATLDTPFGIKPLVYCDFTASGRALGLIEGAILESVLPFYANTHSEASDTGRYTGQFRDWARSAFKQALNGGTDDALIFDGFGATSAINLLVHLLGLRASGTLGPTAQSPRSVRPMVIVGPYEHHSNELPWRESVADVVRVPLDDAGNIDQLALKQVLVEAQGCPLVIGSFSAASNVTGVRSDVRGITKLLKNHGALAIWDYAAAAPYMPIDLNCPDAPIDAVVLSPHKLIGGPGSCGVLAVKKKLIRCQVPHLVGGGTVSYVSPDAHEWHADLEHREEGGTPGIIESIRGAMALSVTHQVGFEIIEQLEADHVRKALCALRAIPGVELLGPDREDRLPVFAIRVRSERGELHYGFVVRLLNDLFGIQARGGCSCAGPYGHSLLNLQPAMSSALAHQVRLGFGCLRPGWLRFNLHWLHTPEDADYILSAIAMVAEWGDRLLPAYKLDRGTGLWSYWPNDDGPKSAHAATACGRSTASDSIAVPSKTELLRSAERLLRTGVSSAIRARSTQYFLDEPWPHDAEALCWFMRSHEGANGHG